MPTIEELQAEVTKLREQNAASAGMLLAIATSLAASANTVHDMARAWVAHARSQGWLEGVDTYALANEVWAKLPGWQELDGKRWTR